MTSPQDGAPAVLTDALLDARYRLEELIGRGGMGTVYRGVDVRLERPVAVKVLSDAPGTHEARFRAEVRTLARFVHPNLVRLLDAGEHENRLYLVMDLIEGRTLAACLREGSLPDEDVARVGADVASALAFVHGQGIVHRDVKPANILIDRSGCSHLADFGIARLVDTTTMTATGLTLGTPAYLAPEQVQGGRVGPEADVYSLGLVLFECAAGRRPFTGTPTEMLAARLHRSPVPPSEVSPRLRETLAKMTALEPERRIGAAEAAERLAAEHHGYVGPVRVLGRPGPDSNAAPTARLSDALDETQLAMAPAPPGSARPGPGASPARRLGAIVGAAFFVVAVFVGALAAAGVFSGPGSPPRRQATDLKAGTVASSSTTTTLPSISKRVATLSARIESALARGTIAPPAAQQLLALLQPIVASPVASPVTDGQLDQVAEAYYGDVANGMVHGARTLHAITVGLSALASAMGTSLPPASPALSNPQSTTTSGPSGASGASGTSGTSGTTGTTGSTGNTGATGATGSAGPTGQSGAPQPPGPPGHGRGHAHD